jgi:ribosome-associated translation inhibitor RaiA
MNLETLFSSNIIVPIIVAFVGFLVAVTTAVIAKEQKVSEFRQAWINNIREHFASLMVGFHNCRGLIANINTNQIGTEPYSKLQDEYLTARLDSLLKIELIKFHLNEIEHKDIITSIDNISDQIEALLKIQDPVDQLGNIKPTSCQQSNVEVVLNTHYKIHVDTLNDELIASIDNLSNVIPSMLKAEWEVVKKGEKRLIQFRSLGELCLCAFITAFFVLFYLAKFPEYFPGIN